MASSETASDWRESDSTARVTPRRENGSHDRSQTPTRRRSRAPRLPVPSIGRDFFNNVNETGIGLNLNWEDFQHSEFMWPDVQSTGYPSTTQMKPENTGELESLTSHGSRPGLPRELSKAPPQPQYPPPTIFAINMFAMYIAVFCVALDNTIISTAIPKISGEFHSLSDVGWYGSGKSRP